MRLADLVVGEQLGGAPRVFGGDEIDLAQRAQRPERQVLEVADGRGDDEEGAGHGVRLSIMRRCQCRFTSTSATSCGHRFERIQKFSDPPLTTCPKCGGRGPEAGLVARDSVQGIRLVHHRLRRRRRRRVDAKIETPSKTEGPRTERPKSRAESGEIEGRRRRTEAAKSRPTSDRRASPRRPRSRPATRRAAKLYAGRDRLQIVAERRRQIRAAQREVDDRFQEPELVAGVVADARDFAGVERPLREQALQAVGELDLADAVLRGRLRARRRCRASGCSGR